MAVSQYILRSRVSALRSQVQVFSTRCSFAPAPAPAPEDPYLIADRRDQRPEDVIAALKGKPETGMVAAGMIHSR